MRGLQKSKKVSWATEGNLCQVKLFLSEDSPSLVGTVTQDHLQPKKKTVHLYAAGPVAVPDDGLPPGFEGVNPETQLLKNKLTHIPLTKWKLPPRFLLDTSWRVTAGEESNDVEVQNQRELRVLEAIYPRPSAIPPNPAVSLDAEGIVCDDSRTPLVPITPIEEEDASEELPNESAFSALPQPLGFAQSLLPSAQYPALSSALKPPLTNGRLEDPAQPQLLAAALTALGGGGGGSSSGGQERLIDSDLLVKLLSNPTILEEFMKRQGNSAASQAMASSSQTPQMMPKQPITAPPIKVPMSNPSQPHFNQLENTNLPSSTMNSNEPFYPPQLNGGKLPVSFQHPPPTIPNTSQPTSLHTGNPPPRDINYFKSLIQQHGGDRQQQEVTQPPFMGHHLGGSIPNPEPVDNVMNSNNNPRPGREPRPKFNKPCLFFNSPKGCRHGANCAYQHDSLHQQRESSIPEMQSAKRMKREMRGSQPYS
ncbi:hypothetical protein V2J09_023870 [Rumex salicifolius]